MCIHLYSFIVHYSPVQIGSFSRVYCYVLCCVQVEVEVLVISSHIFFILYVFTFCLYRGITNQGHYNDLSEVLGVLSRM